MNSKSEIKIGLQWERHWFRKIGFRLHLGWDWFTEGFEGEGTMILRPELIPDIIKLFQVLSESFPNGFSFLGAMMGDEQKRDINLTLDDFIALIKENKLETDFMYHVNRQSLS